MGKDFSYTKLFTILLSVFYISGLAAVFSGYEILFSVIFLAVLILVSLFSKFGFKRIAILYLIFFIGIVRARDSEKIDLRLQDLRSDNAIIKGRVISSEDVSAKNNRVRFYLGAKEAQLSKMKFENLDSKVLVYYNLDPSLQEKITIGDIIEVQGKLRPPQNATNPHEFDYKNYLLNNDCTNILYAKSKDIKKIKEPAFSLKNREESWFYILKKFELTRAKIISRHAKNIKSPELEILGGIVFGNETINPDEKIKEYFKNSGLLHLLAASGLNVALIFGIWWWLANLLRFPYSFSILTGAVFVIFYTFMTGFPPSILRASIMLLFVLFGKIIDRNANSCALVFFVGFLILLFNPKMLFDVGFQLSFAVTIGLVVCCPVVISKIENFDKKFKEKYKNSGKIKKYFIYAFCPVNVVSAMLVPFVAQLWVMPLQMHYFNNFAPLSVFANVAVVPFIGILSFIGFTSSIVALVPVFSSGVVFLFDMIAKPLLVLLIKISEFFASFKFSLIFVPALNIFQMFSVWGLLSLFILNLKYNFKNKIQVRIFLALLFVFVLSFMRPDAFSRNFEIIMFDVDNADCFLLKTPQRRYIMIDTGRKPYRGLSSAEVILNRYLKNGRIKRLEVLILTHFDSDHCGGTIDILKNIKTGEILVKSEKGKSDLSNSILDFILREGFKYKIPKNGEIVYSEPDFTVKTFMPLLKGNLNADRAENETSIVTLVTYKGRNFLFTGDAGTAGFQAIEKNLPSKVDILKVGHHGAKGVIDNAMIQKIKPDYALISTGVNKFNHPHYSTLNLLSENEIKTISTKNYGFVKIIVDKDLKYNFYHFEKLNKHLEKIKFPKKPEIPFHKSKYVQEFVERNL